MLTSTDFTLEVDSRELMSLLVLELALLADDFDESPSIAKADLSALDGDDKSNLLESILVRVACPPSLGDELVAGLDGAGKSGLEGLDVLRLAATELAKEDVSRCVPAEEAVHDGASESHLHTRLGRGMERVVVSVQAIKKSAFRRGLERERGIGSLTLGRRIRLVLGACAIGMLGNQSFLEGYQSAQRELNADLSDLPIHPGRQRSRCPQPWSRPRPSPCRPGFAPSR
jgi:hypothetical protein